MGCYAISILKSGYLFIWELFDLFRWVSVWARNICCCPFEHLKKFTFHHFSGSMPTPALEDWCLHLLRFLKVTKERQLEIENYDADRHRHRNRSRRFTTICIYVCVRTPTHPTLVGDEGHVLNSIGTFPSTTRCWMQLEIVAYQLWKTGSLDRRPNNL